ncbi:MAG TPA: hypothetical protein VF438_04120 [Candidatus Paceibacterota bacterium]
MKLHNSLLVAVTLATASIRSMNSQTIVHFTSLSTPTIVQHDTGTYPEKTAFYVGTFQASITPSSEIAILLGEASSNQTFGTVYQNGMPLANLTPSFSIISGATIPSGMPYISIAAHQTAIIDISLIFSVTDPTPQSYGFTMDSVAYQWGDLSALNTSDPGTVDWNHVGTTTVASLTGPGWSTPSTSAVPEPSAYAAIFGAFALGIACWFKRPTRTVA